MNTYHVLGFKKKKNWKNQEKFSFGKIGNKENTVGGESLGQT